MTYLYAIDDLFDKFILFIAWVKVLQYYWHKTIGKRIATRGTIYIYFVNIIYNHYVHWIQLLLI